VDLAVYTPVMDQLQITGLELMMLHPADLLAIADASPENRCAPPLGPMVDNVMLHGGPSHKTAESQATV
jgi:hypothetical protein